MSKLSHLLRLYHPFRIRTQPGSTPGEMIVDPEAPPSTIQVLTYSTNSVHEETLDSPEQLAELIREPGITWVNVSGLGDEDVLSKVRDVFDIHPLVMEDVVHVHQRAKVEDYEKQLFIVSHMVSVEERLETEQVSIVLGPDFVVTFQEREGDCLTPVRKRLRKKRGRMREYGADYLAYALLDAIIDAYFPILESYGTRLDQIEDDIFLNRGEDIIGRLHQIRGDLLLLRKTLWPHREALSLLMRHDEELVTPETGIYLRDCYDHTVQLIEVAELYRETCSDLRDYHFSQVNLRMNEVMKLLTMIATIFIPLSFIVGLYGMNFDPEASPWNMPELRWRFGYPFALCLMAGLTVSLLGYFYHKGWLGRSK